MISKGEILTAIDELEDAPPTFQNCQKMATFYTLLNAMNPPQETGYSTKSEPIPEEVIGRHGESEFLDLVSGLDSQYAWEVMDELMETIRVLLPKVYDSVIRRIRD